MSEQITDLFTWRPIPTDRHGSTYERAFDYDRLNRQQARVFDLMRDGKFRTLAEISAVTGAPEASASARLRDLRNLHGLIVDRRRRGESGTFEYGVRRP